jgi:hypothetical protein
MRRHAHHGDEIDRRFDHFLREALDAFESKQSRFAIEIAQYRPWSYCLETCMLELSRNDLSRAFPVIPIATYLPQQHDWLWAWANDSLPSVAQERSAVFRDLFASTQYNLFRQPNWRLTPEEVDEVCAMCLHQVGGKAVFKSKEPENWVLLLVKEA